jgi:phosphatidylserine/phosphatidylglycerophosphate/cardiolipin synthase-like enzyme
VIDMSTGRDVVGFLHRVENGIANYGEVVICSPFIDPPLVLALARLAHAARRAQCGFRIITSPLAAKALRATLPGRPREWEGKVIARARLHAKVYIAITRSRNAASEAIVTSANLTLGGIEGNLELGVRIAGTSDSGSRLLQQVHHFVRRLAA